MNSKERDEMVAFVKPQLMRKAESDIDTLISTMYPIIVNAHNEGVAGCIKLVDALLGSKILTGLQREAVQELRVAMMDMKDA